MSDLADLTPDDEADLLAAEYALGLLDPAEARVAAMRTRDDPVFAASVQGWQQRLAPLAEGLAPVAPPAAVKERINRAVFAPPRRPAERLGRLRLWLAGAAAAVVAGVAVLFVVPQPGAPRPDHLAELTLPAGGARIETALNLAHGTMTVTLAGGSLPQGGDIEIWWIAPGGTPVSLGLAPRGGQIRQALPGNLGPGAGVTIALTAEPQGGSPDGKPTGPVIATAPLTIL